MKYSELQHKRLMKQKFLRKGKQIDKLLKKKKKA